jgi:glutaredoxin
LTALMLALACGPERPPQAADKEASEQSANEPAVLDADQDQFVLTYAGERGVFADCTTIAEVPEPARALVGVNLFGRKPPPGKVWVANLSAPLPDGRYPLEAIPRDEFEVTVLGSGRSSAFELPDGLDSLGSLAAPEAPVIVYKTSWCGVCKQLESYLQRKGIEYVAKDIEQDRTAAAELAAKAKAAGVPTGSVPMIDVGGKLLRGFDRNALEKLL